MTTSTLISAVGQPQNQAGPPVPANAVVNAGALLAKAAFTLVITPATGWGEVAINFGPDGVCYPGNIVVYEAPTGTGTVTQEHRFHSALLEPGAGSAPDGAQYFKAEVMSLAPAGATATLTMTY